MKDHGNWLSFALLYFELYYISVPNLAKQTMTTISNCNSEVSVQQRNPTAFEQAM